MRIFNTKLLPPEDAQFWLGDGETIWAAGEKDSWTFFESTGAKRINRSFRSLTPGYFFRHNVQTLDGFDGNGLPNRLEARPHTGWMESPRTSGHYHPRIWRGPTSPPRSRYLKEWSAAVRSAEALVQRARELFRFVEPTPSNLATFGLESRNLLLLASMEVESAWKAILRANGEARERLTTNDYVKLLPVMGLDAWSVQLALHPDSPVLTPFARWSADNPTTSLAWYDSYNAAKHDREGQFSRATVHHALDAVAATFIMILAQFGLIDAEPLPIGDFRIVTLPGFDLDEQYVPPLEGIAADWIASPLAL